MKVTQTMYIHARENYDKTVDFSLYAADMESCGYMLVGQVDITFETPDNFNVTAAKMKLLEKEMADVRAKFQARITQLQAQYNDLLAIEA